MIPLFCEFPSFAPGLTPLVTLGATQANGMRHGFALPADRPLEELPNFVNNRPDLPGKTGENWWAVYHAKRIDAVPGPVGIDLSGHCFARSIQDEIGVLERDGLPIAMWGDSTQAGHTIEAIRRTLHLTDRNLGASDLIFADVEPHAPDTSGEQVLSAKAKFFRLLWQSGVTGDAMIVTPWVADGRKSNGKVPLTAGSCDGRTCHVPGYFNLFADDAAHLDWLRDFLRDIKACGLRAVLHCTGATIDENNVPYSPERRVAYATQAEIATAGDWTQAVIVYNVGGHGPSTLNTEADVVTRQADDAATVEAFRGAFERGA